MTIVSIGRRVDRLLLSSTSDFTDVARRVLLEVGSLPGVARVFPPAAAISRWFSGPITHFDAEGRSVRAWITIGVGRFQSSAAVSGLVTAHVRARLLEHGFDFVEIRVRVALLT